jgi:penicillin V acylase-like amidase (Ntn superfamily)
MRHSIFRLLPVLTLGLLATGSAASIDTPPPPPGACSSIAIDNRGQYILGGNYDLPDPGMVFILKRGLVKTGFNAGTTGVHAQWTSKFASVVFSLLGYQHAWAGMNEAGLAFSTMRLEATENPPPDHRPPLDWLWPQYLLDTCERVEDIAAIEPRVRISTVDHFLVADRFGGVAVVEILNGRMVVHTNDSLCAKVLTNSVFTASCDTWEMMKPIGSCESLGNSYDRFCLGADLLAGFTGATTGGAIEFAFETLREMYRGPLRRHTNWSIVFDVTNLRAYFRTTRNREIRWVDLEAFDLRCGRPAMMLDIDADLSGDISEAFAEFDSVINREFMEDCYRRNNIAYDPADMDWVLRYIESYPCVQTRRAPAQRLAPTNR